MTTADAEAMRRLLQDRFSCRAFVPAQVPEEVVEQIVAAAQLTPSWCNVQPWQVDITRGAATDRLRADLLADGSRGSDLPFPPGYTGLHAQRRRRVGWQLYEAVGVERGDRAGSAREMLRNFEFFGAPHVAVITAPADLGPYAAIDCGLYVQSFLLAAQAHGVATVAQAALAEKSAFLRQWFGIGDDRVVVCAISFGYPDREHRANSFRADRAPLHETVRIHQ